MCLHLCCYYYLQTSMICSSTYVSLFTTTLPIITYLSTFLPLSFLSYGRILNFLCQQWIQLFLSCERSHGFLHRKSNYLLNYFWKNKQGVGFENWVIPYLDNGITWVNTKFIIFILIFSFIFLLCFFFFL